MTQFPVSSHASADALLKPLFSVWAGKEKKVTTGLPEGVLSIEQMPLPRIFGVIPNPLDRYVRVVLADPIDPLAYDVAAFAEDMETARPEKDTSVAYNRHPDGGLVRLVNRDEGCSADVYANPLTGGSFLLAYLHLRPRS